MYNYTEYVKLRTKHNATPPSLLSLFLRNLNPSLSTPQLMKLLIIIPGIKTQSTTAPPMTRITTAPQIPITNATPIPIPKPIQVYIHKYTQIQPIHAYDSHSHTPTTHRCQRVASHPGSQRSVITPAGSTAPNEKLAKTCRREHIRNAVAKGLGRTHQ